jgi:p38 MAP kinase
MLFSPGGTPRVSPSAYPGIRHITRLLDWQETRNDLFIVMEYGGAVLSKSLFDIKGEFLGRGSFQPRERVYRVHHLPFYEAMKRDHRILKRLLRQVLQAIHTLSDHAIVHSDLKPDNLLVNVVEGEEQRCDLRLCDFGSAFVFDQPEQLALATPEYMPPEALEGCVNHASGYNDNASPMNLRSRPWSFDVWSLGAIMLELCYGVPHWLSYKCRVRGPDGTKDHSVTGLFAVPGRDHERILQRQQEIVMDGGLRRVLRDPPGMALDADGLDLLEAMLTWDPDQRISPAEALAHPFLASN